MTKPKDTYSLERVRDETALIDEIWFTALDAAYSRHLTHLVQCPSRDGVIAWYFKEYPGMKRFVDKHIEDGTCAAAVAELRAGLEELRQTRQKQNEEQQKEQQVVPSSPSRKHVLDWLKPFRMESKEIPTRTEIKNIAAVKPKPSNPTVRKWMKERVSNWPDDRPSPSEEEDWRAALDYFGDGLIREELRVVRNQETPIEWRKQGPRRPWGVVKSHTN